MGYKAIKKYNEIEFFEGTVKLTMVEPVHTNFGRDDIFQAEGHDRPYGAMNKEEKNKISMRNITLNNVKDFLEKE